MAAAARWLAGLFLAMAAAAAMASAGLEQAVRPILAQSGIVGAAIIIVEPGAPPTILLHGLADQANARPVTADTRFRIGSISKNLTSLLAVRLAAAGQIDLARPVPADFGIANGHLPAHPVRLVHLLEHTAGIEGSSYTEYGTNRPNAAVMDYVAMRRGQLETRWQPGLFFSYANAGHTLAAAMMEQATATDFDTLMARTVFQPLGMTGASFRTDPDLLETLSRSYAAGRPVDFWALPNRPAGAAMARPADMAALLIFYATDGERPDGISLLPPAWVQRMRTPATTLAAQQAPIAGAYGLGTFGFAVGGRLWYGHWGKIDGFLANMGVLPGTGLGFAILSNTDDGAAMARLRDAVTAHLTRGLPPPVPPPPAAVPLAPLAGHFQPFTHDMPMRSWIWETLGLTRVTVAGDRLQLRPFFPVGPSDALIPVDARRFRVESLADPTAAFVDHQGRRYLVGAAEEAMRAIPAWRGWTHALLAASALAMALVTPLVALIAGLRRLFGRRAAAWPAILWLGLAGLALAALLAFFAAVGLFGVLDTAGSLGRVSAPSLTLAALSLAFPAALLLGLLWLARRWRQLGTGTRLYGALASLTLLPAALYLAAQGWMPVLSWR